MKILNYVLILLLILFLGGAGYYYVKIYQPLASEYAVLKSAKPELDKAKKELNRYREQEKQESAWVNTGVAKLRAAFKNLIDEKKAEVAASGNRIVMNIMESVLYSPHSATFARKSRSHLDLLAQTLKEFKDKEVFIGNLTVPAPPKGKGRRKKPGKDALTIASDRSVQLVKFLGKNGMPAGSLIASAYPQKLPDQGFALKDKKTMIIISTPVSAIVPAPAQQASKPSSQKPAPAAAPRPAPAMQNQQKPIPITAPPKKIR